MSFVRPNKFVFIEWVKDVVNSEKFLEDVKKFATDREMDVNATLYFARNFMKKSTDEKDIEALKKYIEMLEKTTNDNISECKSFKEFRKEALLEALIVAETEEEQTEAMADMFSQEFENNPEILKDIDEGWLGNLAAGVAGWFIGPAISRVICKTLGIEKGIIFDTFTSPLVSSALAIAINKHLGK